MTCSTEMDAGVPTEDGMNASEIIVSLKAIIKAKLFSMNTKTDCVQIRRNLKAARCWDERLVVSALHTSVTIGG